MTENLASRDRFGHPVSRKHAPVLYLYQAEFSAYSLDFFRFPQQHQNLYTANPPSGQSRIFIPQLSRVRRHRVNRTQGSFSENGCYFLRYHHGPSFVRLFFLTPAIGTSMLWAFVILIGRKTGKGTNYTNFHTLLVRKILLLYYCCSCTTFNHSPAVHNVLYKQQARQFQYRNCLYFIIRMNSVSRATTLMMSST